MAEQTLLEIKGTIALHNHLKRLGPQKALKENIGSESNYSFKSLNDKKIDAFTLSFSFYPLQNSMGKDEQDILTLYNRQEVLLQIKIVEQNKIILKLKENGISEYNLGLATILEKNILLLHIQEGKGFAHLNSGRVEIKSSLFLQNGFKQVVAKYTLGLSTSNEQKYFSGTVGDLSLKINHLTIEKEDVSLALSNQLLATCKLRDDTFREDYIEPIKSLQELFYYDCSQDPHNVSTVPLKIYKRNKNKPQVIVCHDMMGGYKQDNFQHGYKDSSHNFRFLEWGVTDYFIYFSHYRVSIPPPSYIDIAHSKGVKCIGTFITEWEDGEKENDLLVSGQYISKENNQKISQQNQFVYADKLIELCKHYKFDGYLINIEAKVSNAQQMAEWTRYLRDRIHTEVPGAVIIFYDSIISSGQLQWQSQLNENNRMFFEASDLFFTDYHWNLQNFQQSMVNAGNRKLDVFTGIDIFGRGTYGGGGFNTSVALHEINRLGSSVAFFAPGWTYENGGGTDSKNNFLSREQEFWHGVSNQSFYDATKDKWDYTQLQPGKVAWEHLKEGNTPIAVTSFFPSIRKFIYKVPDNMHLNGKTVYFNFQVMGTPPQQNDLFVACIEAIDNGRLVYSIDTKNQNLQQNGAPFSTRDFPSLYRETKASWEEIQLELNIPQNNMSRITQFVFYQVGQDVEYWAGYYGARFKNEDIGVKSYDYSKDLCLFLNTKRCCELPIHTFYNDGVGKHYFSEGVQQSLNEESKDLYYYNNIHEFDFDYQHFSKKIRTSKLNTNHSVNYQASIDSQYGWNGLTSLSIKGQLDSHNPILVKLAKTSITDCTTDLFVDLNLRNPSQYVDADLFIGNQSKNLVQMKLMQKKDRGNSWFTYFYSLNLQKSDVKEVKGIYLQIKSSISEKIQMNIGGFSAYNEQIKNAYKDIMKSSDNIIESCKSRENIQNIISPQENSFYADILLKLKLDEVTFSKTKMTRIYIDNKWVENTKKREILLEKVKLNPSQQSFEIKAQIILDNGFHVPLEMNKPFILNINEDLGFDL